MSPVRKVLLLVPLLLSLCVVAHPQILLVNSSGTDSALRFDSYGIYGGVFASGAGLDSPSCIAVAPDGAALIGMRDAQGNGKVQRRAPNGDLQSEYTATGFATPGGVALDAAGNVYASDVEGHRVLRWSAAGVSQGVFASGSGLSSPGGIAFDGEGRLLVVSKGTGQVLRWTAGGSFDTVVATVLSPVDVKVGSSGNIYILQAVASGGEVLELYPDGSTRCVRIGGVNLSSPTGLALRPGDDAMFVTDTSRGVVFWDDSLGWQTLAANGQSGLSDARGLAFQTAAANSQNSINYQGRLTDSGGESLPDGQYTVTFGLYASPDGGQPLWVSAPQTVTTNGGVFTSLIPGVPEMIFENEEVWIEITVGSMTLSPRQQFAAAPYAFQTRYASALSSKDSPIVCSIGDVTVLRLGTDSSFWARATGGATFVTGIDANGLPSSGVSLSPGAGAWSTLSDRAAKVGFTLVDPQDILSRLRELPIGLWSYRAQGPAVKHIGPTAQDFRSAFGVGEDDTHISTVDADGVIMAAIQGVYQTIQENDQRIQELEQRVRKLVAERQVAGEKAQ